MSAVNGALLNGSDRSLCVCVCVCVCVGVRGVSVCVHVGGRERRGDD